MPTIASKIVPGGSFTVVDASQIEETPNAKIMTTLERDFVATVPEVTRSANAAKQRTDQLPPLPPGTGFESARVVENEDGSLSVLDGRRTDGTRVEGGLLERRVRAMPPGTGYRSAETTAALDVVRGDPTPLPYPMGFSFGLDANSDQQIFAHGSGHRRQVTYGPETKAIVRDDGAEEIQISRVSIAGQPTRGMARYAGAPAADVPILRVVIVYGQSLALGHNGEGTQYSAWVTTPPAQGRVLMLSSGVSPLQNNHNATLVEGDLGTLVDAANASSIAPQNNNDTAALSAAVGVMDAHDRSGLVACVALGKGSTTIANLSSGTVPYTNVMTWMDRLMAQAEAQYPGHSVQVVAVAWVHGEADAAMSAADYKTARDALFASLKTDLKAKTGQTADPLFIVGQTATLASGAAIGPAYSALDAAIAGEALYLGPQYSFDGYVDASHGTPRFYVDLGVAVGETYRDWVRNARRPILYATSATLTGTTGLVTFNVPVGGLRLDPKINDPGFFGLQYRDSTMSARIVDASIVSDNAVSYTLNTAPTGSSQVIGIADRGAGFPSYASGARSPLCDCTRRINPFTGAVEPIHASMQQIAIT